MARRSHLSSDNRHPAEDTFERALGRGVVVAPIDDQSAFDGDDSEEWFEIPIAAAKLMGVSAQKTNFTPS
jgi:hypothetical protein